MAKKNTPAALLIRTAIFITERLHPETAQKLTYYRLFKKRLDPKDPQTLDTFSSRVMANKMDDRFRELSFYSDKVTVTSYVEKILGGTEHIIPVAGMWDDPEKIKWDELEDDKVWIKMNNSSGRNMKYRRADLDKTKKTVKKWFREKYWKRKCEMNYKDIKPMLIAQKDIGLSESLCNYNFHCFNGKVIFVICWDENGHRFDVGREYEKLPFRSVSHQMGTLEKPKCYEEMVEAAERLAEAFRFCRVDFFEAGNKYWFGELTFSPAGGRMGFDPDEYNQVFAEMMPLPGESYLR